MDFPERMSIVGVAEPIEVRRLSFQKKFRLNDENVFSDWKEVYVI